MVINLHAFLLIYWVVYCLWWANFCCCCFSSVKSHHNHSKSLLLQSPTKSFSVTPSLTHKKLAKTPKEKRRSSKTDLTSPSLSVGSSLWYTTSNNSEDAVPNPASSPIFELTQEVITVVFKYVVFLMIYFSVDAKTSTPVGSGARETFESTNKWSVFASQ